LANPREKTPEQTEIEQLRRKVGQLERALGRKTYEPGGGGGTLAGLGVSVRAARSRAVVAVGYRPVVVARVAGISRQALYRRRQRRPAVAGPGASGPDDQVIVEVAKANPTDGTRMVAALASRELGRPVNRKRVQRVMRAHRLLQPSRSGDRRRRPGFFRVTRPDELWHADMTKVWTAQHGWVYLHAIIDCCTREITGWSLDLRCRDDEAIACVEAAVLARGVPPGTLTLGTDNGSQFTSRDFRRHLSARGIAHRRGGYRDPESQAFIESWFGQFKKRLAWRSEWESLDQARKEIASYIDGYHRRPHSGLAYRTPAEVATTWRPDPNVLQTPAT
jgi:putative transposase